MSDSEAPRRHDLVIIGTGSGNSIPDEYADLDIAIVEDGKFGGTCLNVGCIPTKMFVHPADLASGAGHAAPLGVSAHVDHVDWPAMRDRIFARVDAIEAAGRDYRTGPRTPNITVYAGRGTFVDDKLLRVALHDGGTALVTADTWVLAAGSRAVLPDDVAGLERTGGRIHTSDTVMRIDALPHSVAIIGGGYIAAEFAHVFASFGATVTQIARGERLLLAQDIDVSEAFTRYASARYDVRLHTSATKVFQDETGVTVTMTGPRGEDSITADILLVATGRRPNGDELGVTATGVRMDSDGRVVVDEFQRTSVEGIWALGDISTHYPLKHVANHEARTVFHNIRHPDDLIASDHRFVPAAVFTEPQVASVGLTEQHARKQGREVAIARYDYAGTAAGWAREDRTGFVKLLADPHTGLLLGAHIIGPEAATVIQPLLQAMSFGLPARTMARGQYWIHPALPEVVENALLALPAPAANR